MTDPLFTRDGHLLDLALERFVADDLSSDEQALCDTHLALCSPCVARLDALRALPLDLPPLVSPSEPPPAVRRPSRPSWWGLGGTLAAVAAAAGVALFVPSPQPADVFQSRGADLHLEVWLHDGDDVSRVFDGDPVVAGDRVRFRVDVNAPGYVIVAGVDATGSVYPGAPQHGPAIFVEPDPEPFLLPGALGFDDTPGEELLVAVQCPEPVRMADLEDALRDVEPASELPGLLPGCSQDSVRLVKTDPEPR